MRQLQVIWDKQAISAAADLTWEQYIFCGPSLGMFLLNLCLSLMTSDKSHGSLLTARFRTRLICTHLKLTARRSLSLFDDVLLRTRRALSLYNVYGNSALLVLNWTLLNSINALLALSRHFPINCPKNICALLYFISKVGSHNRMKLQCMVVSKA